MQLFHTPEEENEFLQSLRARTDGVEPPDSLSPERIRKMLPQRRPISMTRRIAPYAAMAACLAVVLTGTIFFRNGQLSGSPELYIDNAATSQTATAEASREYTAGTAEISSIANFSAQAPQEDYSALYAAIQESCVLEKGAAVGGTNFLKGNMRCSDDIFEKDDTIYSLTNDGQLFVSTEGGAEAVITPEFPSDGTWTAQDLFLSGDRLVVFGEGVFASGAPGSAAVIYDLSQPEKPACLTSLAQSGGELQSVLANGLLILESAWTPADPGDGSLPERFVPASWQDGWTELFSMDEISLAESGSGYAILTCTDLETGVTLSRLAGYGTTPDSLTESGASWGSRTVTWEDGTFRLNER